ncbi:MAG: type IV pilus assembly protein PilM [Verrucomicrobiota bacterium]
MASVKKVAAIDFGSSTLKFALFQVDSVNGLSLLDYEIRDLGLDPSKEEDRLAVMLEGLQGIVSQRKLNGVAAICSLSGQFAFTRFVKLPPVSADQVDQMIGFEAQQNVPFPINEVVWDYQLLGGKSDAEYEALIVAIKDDFIEQAAAAVNASKLSLSKMDVSPLALVNSYFYSAPSATDCTLLIDIGAKCSNLIFVEGNKIFARVIPIGGHMITQNISNEFQEPYKSAELLKHGKGFVGLGGAYADPDDASAARISKIARSVYSRLHAEVSRSISFYRNQQGGSPPQRIVLSGGSAKMSYSDLFFKEKLNIPVEYFNPLQNVAIGPGVSREQLALDAPLMGELVGLGLRYAGETPVEVDLVPASVREKKQKQAQMPLFFAAAAVFFLAFLMAAGVNFFLNTKVQAQVQSMNADLQQKNSFAKKIEAANASFSDARLKADTFDRLILQRNFWADCLGAVHAAVQQSTGLWVTELEISHNGAPITVIPQENSRANQAAPPAQPEGPKPVNLAPYGTELVLRGFFESNLGYDFLNSFVQKLSATGLFEEVKILSRETLEDQVALNFHLEATFKADQRPDFLP